MGQNKPERSGPRSQESRKLRLRGAVCAGGAGEPRLPYGGVISSVTGRGRLTRMHHGSSEFGRYRQPERVARGRDPGPSTSTAGRLRPPVISAGWVAVAARTSRRHGGVVLRVGMAAASDAPPSRARRVRPWPVAVGADAVRRSAASPRFGRHRLRPRQGANGRAHPFQ